MAGPKTERSVFRKPSLSSCCGSDDIGESSPSVRCSATAAVSKSVGKYLSATEPEPVSVMVNVRDAALLAFASFSSAFAAAVTATRHRSSLPVSSRTHVALAAKVFAETTPSSSSSSSSRPRRSRSRSEASSSSRVSSAAPRLSCKAATASLLFKKSTVSWTLSGAKPRSVEKSRCWVENSLGGDSAKHLSTALFRIAGCRRQRSNHVSRMDSSLHASVVIGGTITPGNSCTRADRAQKKSCSARRRPPPLTHISSLTLRYLARDVSSYVYVLTTWKSTVL
mmetsp:Transcript_18015/g.55147  ORF Transcript_18015/g.55147 Transcript_18015/m.55147 type:complete len:281 (+) Transcript_18015:538-1380(+)